MDDLSLDEDSEEETQTIKTELKPQLNPATVEDVGTRRKFTRKRRSFSQGDRNMLWQQGMNMFTKFQAAAMKQLSNIPSTTDSKNTNSIPCAEKYSNLSDTSENTNVNNYLSHKEPDMDYIIKEEENTFQSVKTDSEDNFPSGTINHKTENRYSSNRSQTIFLEYVDSLSGIFSKVSSYTTNDSQDLSNLKEMMNKFKQFACKLASAENSGELHMDDLKIQECMSDFVNIFPKGKLKLSDNEIPELNINWGKDELTTTSQIESSNTVFQHISSMLELEQYMNEFTFITNEIERLTGFTNFIQSGSTVDGFSTPRWFSNDDVFEFEIDLMYIMGHYDKGIDKYIENISSVFIRVLDSPLHSRCLDAGFTSRGRLKNITHKERYISALRFKKESLLFIKDKSAKNGPPPDIISKFLNILHNQWTGNPDIFIRPKEIIGDVASTVTCKMSLGNRKCAISIDHVPGIHLHFIPSVYEPWFGRMAISKWLSSDQIETIRQTGCLIVPKSSKHGNANEEWRYSFSLAEKQLMQYLSSAQRVNYYLIKVLFYKYIKPMGNNKIENGEVKSVFHSYLVKTAMFWMCEKHPPEDKIWNKCSLFQCTETILLQLQKCFYKGNLPHFFVPCCNLLQDVPKEYLQKVVIQLQHMKKNLLFYIPFNFGDMVSTFESVGFRWGLQWLLLCIVIYSLHTYFDILEQDDISLD